MNKIEQMQQIIAALAALADGTSHVMPSFADDFNINTSLQTAVHAINNLAEKITALRLSHEQSLNSHHTASNNTSLNATMNLCFIATNIAIQNQLLEKNRLLQANNEQLQQFASIAAHDLQDPLRMISNYLQLLHHRCEKDLPLEAKEFIEFAITGAKRAQNLINTLLTYTHLENDSISLQKLNMHDALQWALTNLKQSLQEVDANITFDVTAWPELTGDLTQLGRLWQNLISNAVRYRDHSRQLSLHFGYTQSHPNWEFYIHDNGIGIDPRFHQKIFKIFQRLHSREQYEGTGIGLAICQKIVEQHKGKIYVASELNQGAKFIFTIPQQEI